MPYARAVPLVLFGVFTLIAGVFVVFANRKSWIRRRQIMATPTSAIAEATGTGRVEIKGLICASEQGTVIAPFSKRPAVWFRVKVDEQRSSGKSSHWKTIISEEDSRPFLVDDRSGQIARVFPLGAEVILTSELIATSGTLNDATPELEEFLARRGHKSTSWLGFNKTLRYEEELLEAGDTLYALGPSRRDAGPPVHDGYRMSPSTQLVMYDSRPHDELILTNKSEAELTRHLLLTSVVGMVMAVGGAIAAIIGVIIAL